MRTLDKETSSDAECSCRGTFGPPCLPRCDLEVTTLPIPSALKSARPRACRQGLRGPSHCSSYLSVDGWARMFSGSSGGTRGATRQQRDEYEPLKGYLSGGGRI
jgi:hypothetical protein